MLPQTPAARVRVARGVCRKTQGKGGVAAVFRLPTTGYEWFRDTFGPLQVCER